MAYGPQPTGFARKPLATILSEIEEAARGIFGPGLIQTPQSPLGQLNGLCASLAATLWETCENTYQSYDPDQAEGVRLEQLGRIRLLERFEGETDVEYRRAITNAGRARIDTADIARALFKVDDVVYVQVFINPGDATDTDGIPGHAAAVAVIGGGNVAVARALRPYIVPGIDTWGNTRVDVEVDGYCRTMHFVRPIAVPIGLQLTVSVRPDRLGCPPPSASAIALAASNGLTGDGRPVNGRDIDLHLIRTAVSCTYPHVEVSSATYTRLPDGPVQALPCPVQFLEIAEIVPASVTVAIL